ncbi:hypothetical protein [Streptomyces sp. NPDC005538]|uniref:hypothetical protein n=1 Tax=unclassified Streptomyces TaxID=2593676 RepID=UPI0033BC048E
MDVMDRAVAELDELHVPARQMKDRHWPTCQLILALDADCQTRLAGVRLRRSPSGGFEVTRA